MDYNRLVKVIKWNTIANKRQIIRNTIGSIFAFCIIVLSQSTTSWLNHTCPSMDSSASLILFVVLAIIMVWASQVCFNMKTKTTLLSYAMLPATKGEKFVANVFHQTVIALGMFIVAAVVTDVLQGIISFACSGMFTSLILSMLSHMAIDSDFGFGTFANGLTLCILAHSTFVLGGTFFRKHQFLYTAIVMFFVPLVLTSVLGGITTLIFYSLYNGGYDISFEWLLDHSATILLADVVGLLISALFYYLAYRYFCRIQVINNKFFN